MGEVAGSDDAYPLTAGPPGEMLEIAIAARRPRMLGMNMQIGVEAHRM
jgi:hypothetical protein